MQSKVNKAASQRTDMLSPKYYENTTIIPRNAFANTHTKTARMYLTFGLQGTHSNCGYYSWKLVDFDDSDNELYHKSTLVALSFPSETRLQLKGLLSGLTKASSQGISKLLVFGCSELISLNLCTSREPLCLHTILYENREIMSELFQLMDRFGSVSFKPLSVNENKPIAVSEPVLSKATINKLRLWSNSTFPSQRPDVNVKSTVEL